MPLVVSPLDKKALLYARDLYLAETRFIDPTKLREAIGCEPNKERGVLHSLEELGAVREATTPHGPGVLRTWRILPHVVALAAEVERPDVVEEWRDWSRRHRWVGRVIVGFFILGGLVTVLAALYELIDRWFP